MNQAPSPPRLNWARINLWLWLALTVRMVMNALLLEPSNDEGLWLWNARCDHWGLPAHGIMHNALSPVSYWAFRLLFAVTGPSLAAARLLHAGLISGALWALMRAWKSGGQGVAVFLVLLVMGLDPYGFRAWSWSMIEPQLLACLLAIYLVLQRENSLRNAVFLGALIGVAMALKVTTLWLLALMVPLELSLQAVKRSALVGVTAALVASAFFASIYFSQDQERFREMWHIHASGHMIPLAGIMEGFKSKDLRFLFCLAVTAAYVLTWLSTWRRQEMDAVGWRLGLIILIGSVFVALQGDLPVRYMLPVVMLATLELGRLWALIRWPAPAWAVASALGFLVAMNSYCFREYVLHAHNVGGKLIQRVSALAAEQHLSQSVPPSECIHVNQDIAPASAWYLAVKPKDDVFPDLWVQHGASAGPSPSDLYVHDQVVQRGLRPVLKLELYDVFTSDPRLVEALQKPQTPWLLCR